MPSRLMILQSQEEPQLHTAMLVDDKGSSLSQIPDCDPPPYGSFVSGPAAVSAVPIGLANAPTLKSIQLEKRHELISGTYIIDPEESGNEASALQGFAARHSDLVGLTKAADFLSAAPHAVFRNRFGSISLTLATKGTSKQCHRAIVDVSTRHGDIAVNLSSIHPGKCITLKVASRRGELKAMCSALAVLVVCAHGRSDNLSHECRVLRISHGKPWKIWFPLGLNLSLPSKVTSTLSSSSSSYLFAICTDTIYQAG
ncbi:hypothetical protein BDR04DRAFT_863122 [Suillus decipiens]|nr:hypothetical protein BDR04DRAFT_863122 [Suillus decipiens]